ncbi:hypothetical protein ACIA5G_23945 [Amycolatopsis sp. NPDC051758]|uniref:hypothetical protein n=1 Tax=Amycolatopsis sp. NPDC051758 TaxID=3363935 RepID=UPI0037B9834D
MKAALLVLAAAGLGVLIRLAPRWLLDWDLAGATTADRAKPGCTKRICGTPCWPRAPTSAGPT